MPTCAETLAQALAELGITRMYGLPGGEILDFIEAARRRDIEFLLTRDETTASFMADVDGQIQRRPGVCVSTLGPGAVNLTLGVANAYLDRSPMIAITATMAVSAKPFATHQDLDLHAVYRPFTKATVPLDARDTRQKVREAYRVAILPRMGPVHFALPSDVARLAEVEGETSDHGPIAPLPIAPAGHDAVEAMAARLARARRPIVVLGLDLDPARDTAHVRRFVELLGVPVFVTPKAKGMLPEDHPLFFGVCAGVAADHVVVDLFKEADLLVGVGFEPVESDKLWHHTMPLVSIGPVSIAAGDYRPQAELVGDTVASLERLLRAQLGPFDWPEGRLQAFRHELLRVMRPGRPPTAGVSAFEATRCLRDAFARNTIFTTDVGAIKSVTSQAWRAFEPHTFFESNGLSAMGYGLPAAMAARLRFPDRPVLCTMGDGGFGMRMADIETCVRARLHFVTVVYNDCSLSLIQVSQEKKKHPNYGVEYGPVDFAAASAGLGAWTRRVDSLDALADAAREAQRVDRPAVIDLRIDPHEYRAHAGL